MSSAVAVPAPAVASASPSASSAGAASSASSDPSAASSMPSSTFSCAFSLSLSPMNPNCACAGLQRAATAMDRSATLRNTRHLRM